MHKERWRKIEMIFHGAVEIAPEMRGDYLAAACQGDEALRQEIESLLANDLLAEQFLSQPGVVKQPLERLAQLAGGVLDEKYRIERLLGIGGMGSVFLATHLHTKRSVAVKVIAPQFMAHTEFVERFKREAEAAGRLRHPNVVNVTDFGFTNTGNDRLAYLVMEYLDGSTLADLIKERNQLPLDLIVDITEQICLAIEAAHGMGIIHRDLKPENIWLEPDPRGGFNVKVLDFGLAKLYDDISVQPRPKTAWPAQQFEEADTFISDDQNYERVRPGNVAISKCELVTMKVGGGASNGQLDSHTVPEWLTRVGAVMGTPLYMSPEQCHGAQLDFRADIYSLGIIVYEMLAGRPPFTGDLHQLIAKHTAQPPPPLREKRKDLPAPIIDLVMKALAKAPEQRPATARSFALNLRAAYEGEVSIIRSAITRFRDNFGYFFATALATWPPFAAINALCFYQILFVKFDTSTAVLFQLLCYLLPFITILYSIDLATAAAALFLERKKDSHAGNIVVKLITYLPAITVAFCHTLTRSLLRAVKLLRPGWLSSVDNLLVTPISVVEGARGDQALSRSRSLTNLVSSVSSAINIRRMVAALSIYLTFIVATFIFNLAFGLKNNIYYVEWWFLISILLPVLVGFILQPVISISTVLLYFKVREINGELAGPISEHQAARVAPRPTRLLLSRSGWAFTAMLLLAFTSALSYFLFVPPAGKPARAISSDIETIPESENSWPDYRKAIESTLATRGYYHEDLSPETTIDLMIKMQDTSLENRQLFNQLRDFGLGREQLTAEINDYLTAHQKVIDYVKAGALKSRTQYTRRRAREDRFTFGLNQLMAVSYIVVAEAQRLNLEGRYRDAANLDLALVKMATDLSEVFATPSDLICFQIMRNIGLAGLYHVVMETEIDRTALIDIAAHLTELDERLPRPHQIAENSYQVLQRSLEDHLIFNSAKLPDSYMFDYSNRRKFYFLNFTKPFKGLRLRAYNYFTGSYRKELENNIRLLEKMDFTTLDSVSRDYRNTFSSPGKIVGKILSSEFYIDPKSIAVNYYYNFMRSGPLKIYALANAYYLRHGRYPETLKEAFGEAGLTLPLDPGTNLPIGYRLDQGIPQVWLAGIDAKDDGGKEPYDYRTYGFAKAGKDIILKFGEMPFHFTDREKNLFKPVKR